MERITAALLGLAHSERGQDLLEYALLAALIAVAAVAGVRAVGDTIFNTFWSGIGQAV
jgi:Flp pilus assembly pilin Flp